MSLPDHVRFFQRAGTYPPVPELLPVPVYDSHAHLEFAAGDEPIKYQEHLARAAAAGISGVVQVGTDVETSLWSAQLAQQDSRVLAAVALHPNEAALLYRQGKLEAGLEQIAQLAAQSRVCAIGETGLDYFRTEDQEGITGQKISFEAHIEIAKAHNLALQIHDRDAHADVIETLLRVGAPERTIFHCFSGDIDMARICVEHGWYMSCSGVITFSNAKLLREAFGLPPAELLLVETDSPFLTPSPFRGAPNSPYMVANVVRALAEIREENQESLCAQLAYNSVTVFGHWDTGNLVN